MNFAKYFLKRIILMGSRHALLLPYTPTVWWDLFLYVGYKIQQGSIRNKILGSLWCSNSNTRSSVNRSRPFWGARWRLSASSVWVNSTARSTRRWWCAWTSTPVAGPACRNWSRWSPASRSRARTATSPSIGAILSRIATSWPSSRLSTPSPGRSSNSQSNLKMPKKQP